jgi:uncharacterized protein YjbI with pentapeptide repeats
LATRKETSRARKEVAGVIRDPNRQLISSDFEIEFERARAEKRRPELASWPRDLDLSGLDFTNGYDDDRLTGIFSHISFIECRMRNCNLKGCSLHRAQLRDVDLSGSVLHLTELKYATLEKVRLDDTDLRGAKIFYAQLNDVSVAHADVTGATFGSTVIQGIDLSSVDGLAGGSTTRHQR